MTEQNAAQPGGLFLDAPLRNSNVTNHLQSLRLSGDLEGFGGLRLRLVCCQGFKNKII